MAAGSAFEAGERNPQKQESHNALMAKAIGDHLKVTLAGTQYMLLYVSSHELG